MGIKVTRSMRNWLKSVNLWCFDKLLFNADQHIPATNGVNGDQVIIKEEDSLKALLNTQLTEPSCCYQQLLDFDHSLVAEVERDLSPCYLLTAETIKTLFELGWYRVIYLYSSIPFIEPELLASCDMPSCDMASQLQSLVSASNGYKLGYVVSKVRLLAKQLEVKNTVFLELIETVFADTLSHDGNEICVENDEGESSDGSSSDSDSQDDTDEINPDDYSDTARTISKFHAACDCIFGGFTHRYITTAPLFSHYEDNLEQFKDELAGIKSVTCDVVLPDKPTITVDTDGLTYHQIVDKLRVYKLNESVDNIILDRDGNITVSLEW